MLSQLRSDRKARQDEKQPRDAQKGVNIHEEYHRALRTKSYVDFFNKAQLLANQPSIYSNQNKFLEILLEPGQDTIPSIIDTTFLSKTPELKNLMLSYFDISADASLFCSHLLNSINQVQCNYQFIERALGIMDDNNDNYDDDSSENFKQITFELNSFIFSNNPFLYLNNHDFKLISDKNSSLLHRLKSMRKRVGRKVKLMTFLKKTSKNCVMAITANVVAAHTLTSLIMGPKILIFPCESLKRKLPHLRFSRRRFLGKVCDQLDLAAKGSYILNKDFDTMSRLVARLYDEIEHDRAMVQFCLDKDEKFSLQIVKELKKSDVGFRKLMEELKEHLYLCLVTINRARSLVVEEMRKTCIGM